MGGPASISVKGTDRRVGRLRNAPKERLSVFCPSLGIPHTARTVMSTLSCTPWVSPGKETGAWNRLHVLAGQVLEETWGEPDTENLLARLGVRSRPQAKT